MEEEYIRSAVYGVGASGTSYIRKKEHSAAPRPEKSGDQRDRWSTKLVGSEEIWQRKSRQISYIRNFRGAENGASH